MAGYATIAAPFAGTVVRRFVDPGTLAAPGAPLLTVEDASRLRLVAAVTPPAAARLRRGLTIEVSIEGVRAQGRVEGVVPAGNASLVTVQVIVENQQGRYSSGSAATVLVPGASRRALLVPAPAIVRTGDLTGVRVPSSGGTVTRWVRLGRAHGEMVEVLSGLTAGDSVVMTVER
jgi:RND family efflux transporter MFP subunit